MRPIRSLAGTLAGALALAGVTAFSAAAPAAAITPQEALSGTAGIGGYSTGTSVFTDVLNVSGNTDVARLSLSQSAAGVAVGEPLVDQDLLGSSILTADQAGKNAYGHGAAANVGLVQAGSAPPQAALSTAEALSPPPTVAAPTELLSLPLSPVAEAQLLPSTAQAQTTNVNSVCPTTAGGGLISEGTAQVANAQLLTTALDMSVVTVGTDAPGQGVSSSVSQNGLIAPSGGAAGLGLVTVTSQTLAPITLFQGVPGAETRIEALADLQLRATATGGSGSELFYGFIGADGNPVPDDKEVLRINDTVLTSAQVLGGDGIQLSLGAADVFIGAPVHGLNDDPTSNPTVSSTTVAGAVDFIRITVPGTVPTGTTLPVAADSPLAPVLNPVLMPVIDALAPVLQGVQDALVQAGLGVADIRQGHFEALATVPAGGVICDGGGDNPFSEAFKDVSSEGVVAGATFEYTVRFPNRGSEAVTDVQVVDRFTGGPPPLEFVSSDPAPTSREGDTLTYQVGTVNPGEFVDISFVFRVPAGAPVGTRYSNMATISGTFQGRQIEQQVRVDAPTVIPTPTGPCSVERSTKFASNLEVVTGQEFAYFINVSNTGGAECTGVVVTDELVQGVTFVSCSDDCRNEGQRVTFQVGTLAPGASTTLGVIVRVTATDGTLPNTAAITTSSGSSANPSTPGPRVTETSVGAPGRPAGCPASGCPGAAGRELPRTGLAAAVPLLGAMVLLLPLVLLRRRRGGLTD
ncbi:MAG: hypothetical protein ACR2K2_08580 [Mycobacteriales bacterium]